MSYLQNAFHTKSTVLYLFSQKKKNSVNEFYNFVACCTLNTVKVGILKSAKYFFSVVLLYTYSLGDKAAKCLLYNLQSTVKMYSWIREILSLAV